MHWCIHCKCGMEKCEVVAYVDKVRGGYLLSIHDAGSVVSEYFTGEDFMGDIEKLLREGGGKLRASYGSQFAMVQLSLRDAAGLYAWVEV